MKKLIPIFILLTVMLSANAQSLNWNANVENKNFIYLSTGIDFGFTNTLGFAYQLKTIKPTMINADVSMPLGEDLFDDFKVSLGSQMLLMERNKLLLTTKINGVFKTLETNLVKQSSFGLEAGVVLGYYKSSWHIAGEFGYEHVLANRLLHAEEMVANFPEITDGWYRNTGGNFYFGVQGGKVIGEKIQLSLRLGSVSSKFDDLNPLLPFYTEIALIYKVGKNRI